MIITRTCPMCHNTTERILPITQKQINTYQNTFALIQDVFPDLSGSDREFIKTGYCEECQNILFGGWED